MKNKKIIWIFFICIIICITILVIIFSKFFQKNTAKNMKIGNNTNSQEIVNNILNISRYEVTIEVEIYSNKNSNKYKIKQNYIDENNNYQEILEPSNIAGVKIVKQENKLSIENTNLNLVKVFENYQMITDNVLDLSVFIKEYKNDKNAMYEEAEDYIIMNTTSNNSNTYVKNKKLYISKKTGKPEKMEITGTNKIEKINIIYNEVNI